MVDLLEKIWMCVFLIFFVAIVIIGLCILYEGPHMICPNPNCKYEGRARKVPRGSVIVGLFLCLFFLLPGILYFAFRGWIPLSMPEMRDADRSQ